MSLSVWILHLIFGLRAFTFNDLVNKIQTARTWMVPFVIFDCRINFGKSHNGWVKFILWITYSYNYITITLSSLMIIRMKSKYLTNITVICTIFRGNQPVMSWKLPYQKISKNSQEHIKGEFSVQFYWEKIFNRCFPENV